MAGPAAGGSSPKEKKKNILNANKTIESLRGSNYKCDVDTDQIENICGLNGLEGLVSTWVTVSVQCQAAVGKVWTWWNTGLHGTGRVFTSLLCPDLVFFNLFFFYRANDH